MTVILHRTRSMRLIVRPAITPTSPAIQAAAAKAAALIDSGTDPALAQLLVDIEGLKGAAQQEEIIIENLEGNEGLEMQFSVRRGVDMRTSSAMVKIFNLPDNDLQRMAGASRTIGRIEDVDLGGPVWSIGMLDEVGTQATPAALGYAAVELQAGYDGALSTIFAGTLMDCMTSDEHGQTQGSDGRSTPGRMHGITSETTLTASSGIAQVTLSSAGQTFAAGSSSFAVLDTLRRVLKLGPGNCSQDTWLRFLNQSALHTNKNGQALFSATSVLAAPYIVTDAADEQLEQFLKYTGIRYFIDEGELWLVPRIGYIAGPPAKLEPLKERPRPTPSGQLEVRAYLSVGARPGHLVDLDDPDIEPSLVGSYRCDHVDHDIGSNASEEASTTLLLSQRRPLGSWQLAV